MKKLILLSAVSLCAYLNAIGQSFPPEAGIEYRNDALRFTNIQPIGSTRIQSIGGAQTALGGDISNAAGNPAGLGFFNKSEFSITPTVTINNASTNFLRNTTNNSYGNLNINNLGFVFSKAKDPIVPGKWRGGSFAITFNTLYNYNNQFKYSGVNDTTSITDSFVDQANGVHVNTIKDEYNDNGDLYYWRSLAYKTFLIDTLPNSTNRYYSFNELESVRQAETVTTKGSKSQWNFAYGGNYNDKLYFGASLGLTSFRYSEQKTYTEKVLTDRDGYDDLNNLTLTENLTYRGSGINLAGGLVYRPTNLIRLGASFQTPTYFYKVTSQYDGDLEAIYNNFQYSPKIILKNEYGKLETTQNTYKFRTPWKLSGGIALFINKNGFISADADYIAYNQIKLSPSDNYLAFNDVNQNIKNYYKPCINFRVGGEYRYSIFRFRGGYSLYGATLDNSENSIKTQYISGGAGLRLTNFYLDLGFVNNMGKNNYQPYSLNDNTQPVASIKNSRTKGMITLGFFF